MAERPVPKHPDPVLVYDRPTRLSGPARRRIALAWIVIVASAIVGALGYSIWTYPAMTLGTIGTIAALVGLTVGVPWAFIELTENQPKHCGRCRQFVGGLCPEHSDGTVSE